MTGRTKLFLTPAGADGAGLEVTVAGTTRARTRFLRAIRTTPGHGVLVCTGPLAEVALSPPDRSVLVLGRRTL
jgi:hypothetical protein